MPGGKLENLDEICTALRTYQSVPKQFNKNQQKNGLALDLKLHVLLIKWHRVQVR